MKTGKARGAKVRWYPGSILPIGIQQVSVKVIREKRDSTVLVSKIDLEEEEIYIGTTPELFPVSADMVTLEEMANTIEFRKRLEDYEMVEATLLIKL